MRKYGQKEIDFLQAETGTIAANGTTVLVKRSPSEPRSGYLDHHELSVMQAQRAAMEGVQQDAEPSLQAMRDGMGFPGRNLNTVEIHTKFETLTIGENQVGLWRYYPRKPERKTGRPCLVFFHGGGWMGGSTYTVENCCKLIAELADAVVFNVDYALAPEKKYPHGFNDCYGAVRHVHENAAHYGVDASRIAIGGDSAGGNLAAAVAMRDRDMGTKMVALQVLIYPCVTFLNTGIPGYRFDIADFEMAGEQREIINGLVSIGRPRGEDDDSVQMGDMYVVTREAAYLPYVSPMLAHAHTSLPRALCVSAEFDGLRTQTEHYAMLMERAGVPVRTIRYRGVAHAFMDKLGYVPQSEDLCIEIANAMKEL